jgi:DNA-binding XRE family transcriptional regulator
MNDTVLVVTNQTALAERWRAALRGVNLAAVAVPVSDAGVPQSAVACVFDAESFVDGDALLAAAALASSYGTPIAVDLGRGASCDELVVDLAAGRVATSPADVGDVARRLARGTLSARDPRIEFVTLSPDRASLLIVLSSGTARLEPRPLHPDDDGSHIASITLMDDGLRAEIVTSSGAAFFWTLAPEEALDGASVGRRVRDLRIKAGITQAELARRTGIHRPNIARVEAGRHTPSLETVARLAEALGTSPARILEGAR